MPADNTVSANSLKTENENQAKEWEKIRDLFEKYDERLHDLRKYGFTFLTGLLTVGSFVTQTITSKITVTNVDSSTETLTPIPGIFNLGVFVITLLLIIALHLFDKNYRVFQSAAMTRAKVLERKLNLELSETISERYKANKIERYVSYVYLIFIIGVAILGIAILYPSWVLMIILAILAIGAGIFNNIQDNQLKVVYDKGKLDWTISPLEVTKNDTIRIVVNNLGDISYPFPSGKIWTIIDQDQNEMKTANGPLTVNYNYTWLVKPCDFKDKGEKGIYLVKPEIWGKPLPINIIVSNPIATEKTSVLMQAESK